MRLTIRIAVVLLVCVLRFAVHAHAQGTPYETREFTVRPGAKVKVSTVSGNIQVRGSEGDQVKVDLFVRRGLSFFQRGQALDDVNIHIYQRDNTIVAHIQSKRGESWSSSSTQYNFILSVPTRSHLDLNSSGGNVEVSQVDGTHSLRTAGGNIQMERITGDIKAYSAGGNIRADDIRGVLHLVTLGGNADLTAINGDTRFRVMGGNLNLSAMRGDVIGETQGGSIRGDVLSILHGIDLAARGGSIHLSIPAMPGLNLNVRGNPVKVNRLQNFDGEIRSTLMNGTINGGGVPVKLRADGGIVDLNVHQDRP